MVSMRRFCLSALAVCVAASVLLPGTLAHADATTSVSSVQEQINANTQEINTLNQEIAQYQAEIQTAQASQKTLQGAINTLTLQQKKITAQIAATQSQINTTQLQIEQLGAGIATTSGQITASEAAIADDIQQLQEGDDEPLLMQVLSSDTLSQAWDNTESILEVESAIQSDVQTLQTQKTSLTASQNASQQKQNALTTQKKSLASQQATLAQTEKSKNELLAETNASETKYEQLLAQAQAQLASFSAFSKNAGGSGLLQNQTVCDAWGCYFNQRDAAWGDDALNGTQYNLASDGCLVTSMAMILTHYGYRDVTPVTINSNPNNFAAYYPAYLLFTINVDGATVTRIASVIDATLATGNPVVVGINAYGGTHYVVLVSGSNGNYLMRDPYIANGDDISFTAHYSLKSIFGISKVEISS